ncbi:MAG: hypothetical protein ACRBCK_08625 [Alphaproteobacteria bacterium]
MGIMQKKQEIVIRLERDGGDHLLPKHFFDIIVHRFLPVISLTYLGSIFSVALNKGDFLHYLLFDNTAYVMALLVVLWVSGPAIIWIFLRGSPMFRHVADLWYKIIAGLMVITISLSYLLFPEGTLYGLRIYFVLTTPVLVLIYLLFVKGRLPSIASYPLNALGFCALLWGALVNLLY